MGIILNGDNKFRSSTAPATTRSREIGAGCGSHLTGARARGVFVGLFRVGRAILSVASVGERVIRVSAFSFFCVYQAA
jgi:hypothetical protein